MIYTFVNKNLGNIFTISLFYPLQRSTSDYQPMK